MSNLKNNVIKILDAIYDYDSSIGIDLMHSLLEAYQGDCDVERCLLKLIESTNDEDDTNKLIDLANSFKVTLPQNIYTRYHFRIIESQIDILMNVVDSSTCSFGCELQVKNHLAQIKSQIQSLKERLNKL